jgi:hypothetical protein
MVWACISYDRGKQGYTDRGNQSIMKMKTKDYMGRYNRNDRPTERRKKYIIHIAERIIVVIQLRIKCDFVE